ncbi:acyl-CoA thioesterase domain-containing protein [Nocardioides massiliensis]|uniref:Thioesterase family protein n=1 Tax=Nocardioides massiliensis TaxID=1325935 RepID=A0ABT9NJY8_9ACTN|nr:acyl-CoA thioesterase domain-containing protein [Nocardioides massiliensis]MDP9820729.1 hypothetical protein [Nocardioides massiliensis]
MSDLDETVSFFHAPLADGSLPPTATAKSLWNDDQLHGVAVGGAMGRAAEHEIRARGRDDLRPARVTVDLFRPARVRPCHTRVEVVRESPRLLLLDVVLEQDGDGAEDGAGERVAVARASVLALKATENAPGEVWMPDVGPEVPATEDVPPSEDVRPPFFWSESVGWSHDFTAYLNAERKQLWQTVPAVVAGERPSPFVAAAAVADSTSMVTNWGTGGVEYINTDYSLTLARLPVGREIGLSATDRVVADGISVGTVVLYDRAGRIGSCTVTALANARRAVDFRGTTFTREGMETAPGV